MSNDDYIKRSDAITLVSQLPAYHGSDGAWVNQKDALDTLNAIPAINLLEEQEYEPKAILDPEYGDADWYCGNCGELIDIEYDSYCPSCGGKIKEHECGSQPKKSDEIPSEILQAYKNNEEKIKAKVEELNEEFIAQKRFQIKQLEAKIEELKSKGKSLDYKEFFKNPPIYPAYTGFNKCGEEEEETEPCKLYINACDPINKKFMSYICNKCNADIDLFNRYCPNCGRKINWKAFKNESK